MVGEVEFEDTSFCLTLGDDVDGTQGWRQCHALVVIVEETALEVERVDRIKLDRQL